MEKQDIHYVENVCYIMLDQNFKKGKYFLNIVSLTLSTDIDKSRQIDISSSFIKEPSNFLFKSKKTMLIFRRVS